MVDNITTSVLDKLVRDTNEINTRQDEEKKKAKLEQKLTQLLKDRSDLNPASAEALRQEAMALGKMADYTDHLAKMLEKNKKQIEKKKLEEVKKLLMEQLGVPAEFIDQLSILVKAGPEALREASALYRNEAIKKKEEAAFMTQELHRIDREIKEIAHVKDNFKSQKGSKQESMSEFLNRKLYEDAIRDDAELELKLALELIEGKKGAANI